MDIDPLMMGVNHSDLQNFSATQFFALDQGVEFWKAAQDLIHPDVELRRSGLETLMAFGAASYSPLLAYLLVSRLAEPELQLRARIVKELSRLLDLPFNGNQAINEVIYFLKNNLSQMHRNQIVSLLNLADAEENTYQHVCKIIGQCSYAGDHLADIIADRGSGLAMRQIAARLVGDIGYLSALPTLERISSRLEAKRNNSSLGLDRLNGESALLPILQDALSQLKN